MRETANFKDIHCKQYQKQRYMSTSYDIRAITYCMFLPIVVISIVYINEKCSNSQIKKLSNKAVLLYFSPIIVHHAFLNNI